jgi:hypothetical protein
MLIHKFHMADTGAAGSATPAPAAGAAAPAAAPAAPAAAPAPDASALEKILASVTALTAKVDSLEGVKAKAEADKNAAETKAKTFEERFAESEKERINDKIGLALEKTLNSYTFSDADAREQALTVFRSAFKVEAKDGAVLAFGQDGKPQHVASAFAEWAKAKGARYLASNIQPGAGATSSSVPESGPKKAYKDMTREEQRAVLEQGVSGKLTPDAPFTMTYKRAPDPMLARRMEILGRIGPGAGGAKK